MVCKNCGAPAVSESKFCAYCGSPLEQPTGPFRQEAPRFEEQQFAGQQGRSAEFAQFSGQMAGGEIGPGISPKSRLAALLLCFFLGWIGAHRFYAGKIGTGILIIITFGGFFGLWPFIDLIIIIVGGFTDEHGRRISLW